MSEKAEKPAAPDWEAIERDYRAGIKSLREIAAKNGPVTEGAIRKRAKRDGWERNLQAKIQAKADALVRKAAVRKAGTQQLTPATEREVIEENAQAIADIRLAHRADIRRGRTLVLSLLTELEGQTTNRALFEQLGELMAQPDENGRDRLADLYHKVIGLSGRVSNVKALAEALKNLIGLEREAWNLDAKEQPKDDPTLLSDAELEAELHVRLGAARAA